MSISQKIQEITEFATDRVEELADYDESCLDDIYELHHEIFNTDYYIIGTYRAKQWLGSDAFDAIGEITEYEKNNFGQLYTDLSSPEAVVNMYVYIIGEQILQEVVNEYLNNKAA